MYYIINFEKFSMSFLLSAVVDIVSWYCCIVILGKSFSTKFFCKLLFKISCPNEMYSVLVMYEYIVHNFTN